MSAVGRKMPRFEQHSDFLGLVTSAFPKQRKAILRTSSHNQRLAIAEIFHNFLQGTIPEIEEEKKEFFPHRSALRLLARKSVKGQVKLFERHGSLIARFLKKILPKLK